MANPAELARQAETLDEQQWYEFLDALDEVSRRRRQQQADVNGPEDVSRDAVARWVARKHFLADRSIREIWHLSHNAPDNEIRFLEVNEFLAAPSEAAPAPVDFGLDIEGCDFRLLVVDLTSEQLDGVRQGTHMLPAGWTLENAMVWRRSE